MFVGYFSNGMRTTVARNASVLLLARNLSAYKPEFLCTALIRADSSLLSYIYLLEYVYRIINVAVCHNSVLAPTTREDRKVPRIQNFHLD